MKTAQQIVNELGFPRDKILILSAMETYLTQYKEELKLNLLEKIEDEQKEIKRAIDNANGDNYGKYNHARIKLSEVLTLIDKPTK